MCTPLAHTVNGAGFARKATWIPKISAARFSKYLETTSWSQTSIPPLGPNIYSHCRNKMQTISFRKPLSTDAVFQLIRRRQTVRLFAHKLYVYENVSYSLVVIIKHVKYKHSQTLCSTKQMVLA